MSKLLILYMTRDDENDFLGYVQSFGGVQIFPATSPTANFTPMIGLPEPSQEESRRRFWLYYNIPEMPLATEPATGESHYVVDAYQSPVIEFWRSWMVSQILMPGGIEAEFMRIDNEKQDLEKKPKEFRDWFESIEAWIHKNFVQLGIHIYAGPGAIIFRNDGGILQGR